MWKRFGDLISDRLGQSAHQGQFRAVQSLQIFSDEVVGLIGEEVAKKIHPKKVVDGVITIEVEHPAIAQILRQHESYLLRKVSAAASSVQRLEIRVRQGDD